METHDRYIVIVCYFMALLFLFPILRYVILFEWNVNPNADDQLVVFRVFFSGPILVLTGLLLLLKYKRTIHRLPAIIFFTAGCVWIIAILRAFLEEAG